VFHNLVKGMELVGANQAWAADITYIRSDEGFLYLSLLMDLWSRKIVGYHAGDTLEAEGAVCTLKQALRELPKRAAPVTIRTAAANTVHIGMLKSSRLTGFR
jgi:transposase InsO family protein